MSRRPSYHAFCSSSKRRPVPGMNCQMPEACAREYAIGLKALSTIGSSASSIGMPRRSISSTMW